MSDIIRIGGATGNNGATADTASVTMSYPGASLEGDVVMVGILLNSNTITLSPPAGWTQVVELNGSNNNNHSFTFRRTLVAADLGGSVTFTPSSGNRLPAVLDVFRFVDQRAPVEAFNSNQGTTSAVSGTAPTTTALDNNVIVYELFTARVASGVTPINFTTPSGMSVGSFSKTNLSSNANFSVGAFYKVGNKGTVGGDTSAYSSTSANGQVNLISLLKPQRSNFMIFFE